jgi:hypothetical protein
MIIFVEQFAKIRMILTLYSSKERQSHKQLKIRKMRGDALTYFTAAELLLNVKMR